MHFLGLHRNRIGRPYRCLNRLGNLLTPASIKTQLFPGLPKKARSPWPINRQGHSRLPWFRYPSAEHQRPCHPKVAPALYLISKLRDLLAAVLASNFLCAFQIHRSDLGNRFNQPISHVLLVTENTFQDWNDLIQAKIFCGGNQGGVAGNLEILRRKFREGVFHKSVVDERCGKAGNQATESRHSCLESWPILAKLLEQSGDLICMLFRNFAMLFDGIANLGMLFSVFGVLLEGIFQGALHCVSVAKPGYELIF